MTTIELRELLCILVFIVVTDSTLRADEGRDP